MQKGGKLQSAVTLSSIAIVENCYLFLFLFFALVSDKCPVTEKKMFVLENRRSSEPIIL